MKTIERAMLSKELARAQTALRNGFTVAAGAGDLDLAKLLREQAKVLGGELVKINGGPVRMTFGEMLCR